MSFRTASLAALVLALPFALTTTVSSQVKDSDLPRGKTSRAEFMRMKLDYSKGVLDGLVNEKFDQIAKDARALKKLSEAAEWEVPGIPNVQSYIPFTREFQRITESLQKQAKEKNLDGALNSYVQLTMNCVNCHKYVRDRK